MKIETTLIHHGEPKTPIGGAVSLPIFQSVTYTFGADEPHENMKYLRFNNTPNQTVLGDKLAALEGAEAAIVTASGMAAISTALLALIPPGGELLIQDTLYGGVLGFLQTDYPSLGRKVKFFSLDAASDLDRMITADTKAVYVESISNPMMRIPDFAAVLKVARARKLLAFIDNTFPSPVNFNPIALGFDVVLHSATKYLNGHSDVLAGAVMGRRHHVDSCMKLLKHLGGTLDPHACFLLHRGVKTLAVRVRYQSDSALQLARALEKHPKVARVAYPGLPSHPDHARAREMFRGFGGMLAFEYRGSGKDTDAALSRLELPYVAPSLGGVESLVTRPALTSHSWLPAEKRAAIGITDNLVRVSVGLENPEDLVRDFEQALA